MKNQLPYLQMSETQIANEFLHGNLCGSQHFLFEHCTTLQSIEHIRDLSRPARTIKIEFFFLFPGFLSLVLGLLEQLPFAFSSA